MDNSYDTDASPSQQVQLSDRSILLAAKGGSIVFAGAAFSYGCQFIIGILLTRLLGAEQFGMYKIAVTAGEIAISFALLGMNYAMVRFVALYVSQQDKERLWGTLQVGPGLTTLLSVLIGIGIFALANPLAIQIFHEARLIPLLRLASVIVPFLTLSRVLASATNGFNNMKFATIAQQIVQPLVRIILIVLLAVFGLTAGKAIIAYVVGIIATCVLLVYFLDRLFPLRRPFQTARRDTKGILHFSLPVYFSGLIDTIGPNLQTILLGSLNTVTTVGIFAAASQVSMVSSMFNNSIGTSSSPIVSALHGQKDKEQMTYFYQTTTKWMFLVNLPFFLVLLILSVPILSIFGEEFVKGSTALTILALANLVIAAAGISDGVLAMTGNTPAKLANSTVQAVLSIGLCFLFIPRLGAVGASLAVLITATVVNLLRLLEVYVMFRMFPYNKHFLKPIMAGLVALIIGWFTRMLFHSNTSLLYAALNGLIILAVYGSMILLLRLSPEDQAVIAYFRTRIPRVFPRW